MWRGNPPRLRSGQAQREEEQRQYKLVQARGDVDSFYERTREIVCSWKQHVHRAGITNKGLRQCYDEFSCTYDMCELKEDIMPSVIEDIQDLVQRCKELEGWQGLCALVTMVAFLDSGEACEEISEWILEREQLIGMGGAMGEVVKGMLPLEASARAEIDVEWLKERRDAVSAFGGDEGQAAMDRLLRAFERGGRKGKH